MAQATGAPLCVHSHRHRIDAHLLRSIQAAPTAALGPQRRCIRPEHTANPVHPRQYRLRRHRANLTFSIVAIPVAVQSNEVYPPPRLLRVIWISRAADKRYSLCVREPVVTSFAHEGQRAGEVGREGWLGAGAHQRKSSLVQTSIQARSSHNRRQAQRRCPSSNGEQYPETSRSQKLGGAYEIHGCD